MKLDVLSFPGKAPSLLLPDSAGVPGSSDRRDLTDSRRKSGDSCGGCGEGPEMEWCKSSEPSDEAAGVGGIRTLPFEGLDDWYRTTGGDINGLEP